MKTYSPGIILILFLLCVSVSGNSVKISGSGTGYKNAELGFFRQTDPVTKKLKPVLSITCDEKGSFSCEIPCNGSDVIFIRTGIYSLHLYVKDSSAYELLLPDYVAREVSEEQNPFFIETELIPAVINNKQDVNNLIMAFDSEYNTVFNVVAERVFRNYKKEEIQKDISKLAKFNDPAPDSFYNDYVKCRMIMLNLVFSNSTTDLANAGLFINAGFDAANPGFIELAEQMFSGYFNKISSGPLRESFFRAISIASFRELRSVMQQDGKLSNSELTDLVILMNLNDDYFNHNLPDENVRKIISLIISEGATSFTQNIASEVLGKMNSSLPGNIAPDFTLSGTDGKLMSLKDFRGKYLLLSFARADNQASVMELGIINMWQKKYVSYLNVVTILTDKDFKSASGFFKNRGFNWIFLDGSKKDMIEFTYDLKMYPSFILLDRNGKIVSDPCQHPSENLEVTIGRLVAGYSSGSGIENR